MRKKDAYSSLKILHDLNRIDRLRKNKSIVPKTIRIDLNTICNHNCKFCLYQENKNGLSSIGLNENMPKGKLIDSEKLCKLIKQFSKEGVESIVLLGGGEPMLHPDFEKIVKTISKHGLEWGIITNGSRTKDLLKYKNDKNFKWVRVSLDASTSATWKKIHRPKDAVNFNRIIKELKELNKNKREDFLVGLSFVLYKDNYNELGSFIDLSKKLKIDNVRISLDYSGGSLSQHKKYLDKSIKLVNEAKRKDNSEKFTIFNKISPRSHDIETKKNYSKCRFMDFSLNLGADLCVYTCCFGKYSPAFKLGDLKETDFKFFLKKDAKKFKEKFTIDLCPPCWYSGTNRVLEYITQKEPIHSKFIG